MQNAPDCSLAKVQISSSRKLEIPAQTEHDPTQLFLSLPGHLDFLGVTLKPTYYLTRGINGDALRERINRVVGPWRGGRFMSLSLRPHSTNLYAFSKLLYRCNTIVPRVSDLQYFNSTAKKFIYADLLLNPNELILFRDISQGGLGLTCMKMRARAALISTFLETAINHRFIRNHYHNQLYRCRILSERAPALKAPPALTKNSSKQFIN